jgi:cardiolipin synthase
MITCATFVRNCGTLLAILALAGCASPSGSRNRYLAQVEPDTLKNLIAFRATNTIEIDYPMHGRHVLAHATWAPVPDGGREYRHQFAVLTFDKQDRATRKAVTKKGNRVPLRDAQQWRQLVEQIVRRLVPNTPGHGTLLLMKNQEVVAFRDPTGKLDAVRLENKPPDVTVDRTFNDTDFSREAVGLLESQLSALDENQTQFLFVTGQDPAFVFIDLKQRSIVYLSYPVDPEMSAGAVPGWFVLRAVNSLLIKSFALTAIKNPFTLVSRGLWHIGHSGATMLESGSESLPDPPPLATGAGMDLAAWEKDLDEIVSSRRYKGRLQLFIDGEQFFPALIQSIAAATRNVDVLVYIFDNDDYAVKIADLLKEHSAAVRVRVLMDEMGSMFAGEKPPHSPMPPDFRPPGNIKSYLRAGSRVQVRSALNPWFTADHRKLILIDRRQAYLGGMNIGREYRYEWHDLMVGLTGPVVGRLEKDFRKAWAHAGWLGDFAYAWVTTFARSAVRRFEITDGIDIRPLRTETGKIEIYRAQLEAIRRAKRYIYIENAYFDDDTMLRELIRARRRGVDVRVILPAESDIGIMQTSNLVMANDMIRNGIRVYTYPIMTHVKAAICDGWACLGSANLNKMSLRVCQELDVAFSDPATVDRLKGELFDADFARSHELKQPVPANWIDSLVKAFADQL